MDEHGAQLGVLREETSQLIELFAKRGVPLLLRDVQEGAGIAPGDDLGALHPHGRLRAAGTAGRQGMGLWRERIFKRASVL